VNGPVVSRVVRAAGSVGANYRQADDSATKKEFRHRISLCRRESREAKHWLRLLAAANEGLKPEIRALWQEAKELNLIFSKRYRSSE